MGWLKKLLGFEMQETVVMRTTSRSGLDITVTRSDSPMSSAQARQCALLKEATAFKKQQNMDDAIRVLRAAFDLTRAKNLGMTIQELMRLGKYLVLAGRHREAWDEFQRTAQLHYTPHWRSEPHARYSTMGTAYDCMCNMQMERGKIEQAVAFGAAGYLLDRVVAWINHETCPVGRWNLKEGLADCLTTLLQKQRAQLRDEVKVIILKHLEDLKHPKPEKLISEVFDVIRGQGDVFQFQE